jgi:hypothetical protein
MLEGGLRDVPLYGRPKVWQKGTPRKPYPIIATGKAEEARRKANNAAFVRMRTGRQNHPNRKTTSLTQAKSHRGRGIHKDADSRDAPTHPPWPQDPF